MMTYLFTTNILFYAILTDRVICVYAILNHWISPLESLTIRLQSLFINQF